MPATPTWKSWNDVRWSGGRPSSSKVSETTRSSTQLLAVASRCFTASKTSGRLIVLHGWDNRSNLSLVSYVVRGCFLQQFYPLVSLRRGPIQPLIPVGKGHPE